MTAAPVTSAAPPPQRGLTDRAVEWSARHGPDVLRIAFGILFLWLGLLKVFPGVSPAEPLMKAALPDFVPKDPFIRFAAVWEILVGVGFLSNRYPRAVLLMVFATMAITLSIPIQAPARVWTTFPFVLSFEGEYVVKDLVIASCAIVLASHTFEPRPRAAMDEGPPLERLLARIDQLIAPADRWAQVHGPTLVRLAYGTVFVWFGALNLFPDVSPARPLLEVMYGGAARQVLPILGAVELAAGIAIVANRLPGLATVVSLAVLAGTMLYFPLRPAATFQSPFVLTLEGQHILKNLVYVGAALVIFLASRGGGFRAAAERSGRSLGQVGAR
ncbi:MAG TPA: DoxX-like family protein [Candidatus Limnocylindrales bacterium]